MSEPYVIEFIDAPPLSAEMLRIVEETKADIRACFADLPPSRTRSTRDELRIKASLRRTLAPTSTDLQSPAQQKPAE